ncbi:hypothetical protein [Xanthobacter sp. KR7-225]|uniref:hypothetical protein n=1 Tax=Xanthobacter sp. KR7-225 TaxID=3156613 RepID=UPI0032B3376E
MDHIFDYAVLQAVPDQRRGERVNIGIAILRWDGLDIRVFETRKIQALTGQSWDSYIDSFSSLLKETDDHSLPKDQRLAKMEIVQGQISLSKTGWFKSSGLDDYESAINEIVKSVILRPARKRSKDETTIVAEISAEFRAAQILATKKDNIRSGKVFRNYEIEAGIEADFAQLNSKLHVAAVLDLRSAHPQMAQAALKAITLDRAEAVHSGPVHKIGVYAVATARRSEVRENINLLGRYADDLVNWEDDTDRRGLKRMFFDAYNSHIDGQV